MNKFNFYLTTTLPYVNAPLHMGHAVEFVRADSIFRYKKMSGYDVFFNTGTDEHGIKILEKAKEKNLEPQAFVDEGFLNFKEQLKIFGVSEEVHFIRTTDEGHIKGAQVFWKKCRDNGFIYKKNYQAKYCVGCESEKTDSELNEVGECPDHLGKKIETIEEENYFFKYSIFQEKLLNFYEDNPDFIIPDFRFNEIKNFVKNGLQDFSISRLKSKMPWGIPVPDDDEHVMYVWFDALTNYINTLGWYEDREDFKKYWLNGNPTQYCGKDNTRFQGAMWQAMLMGAGLPNSHQVVVNGFVLGEGGVKMSKTIGNVVNPDEIVNEYGVDALRYFLLREVSPFEDSPFSKERFKDSYNAGLANGLGNLVSRIMRMVINYEVSYKDDLLGDETLISEFDVLYFKDMEAFNMKKVLDDIWENKIKKLDQKIADEKPFEVFSKEPEKAKEIVYVLILKLYEIAFFLKPFLSETSDKIIEIIKNGEMPKNPLFLRK